MTETVVVGVDGTSGGDAALAWAIDEARLRRGDLHVVIAKSQHLSAAEHVGRDEITPAVLATLLREALERVGGAGDVPLTMVPRDDHPLLELSLEARARRASLIVVGSHPHGWIRNVLGDTPTALLRHRVQCPIVAVPVGGRVPGTGPIVVVGAASEAGTAARRWAIAEGSIRDAAVTVVPAGLRGDGADALLASAAGAALLVLGAPRHLRFEQITGHHTSRMLLRTSTVPLVVVPADTGWSGPGRLEPPEMASETGRPSRP